MLSYKEYETTLTTAFIQAKECHTSTVIRLKCGVSVKIRTCLTNQHDNAIAIAMANYLTREKRAKGETFQHGIINIAKYRRNISCS